MNSKQILTVSSLMVFMLIVTPNTADAAYITEVESNDVAAIANNLDAYFSDDIIDLAELDSSGATARYCASVFGFSGDSTYDYFKFSVGMGNTPLELNDPVVFDIDFAEVSRLDTVIALFDTDGTTLLKFNDDTAFNGPGDLVISSYNSFMTYTFTTAGVYYIRVGEENAPGFPYGDVLATNATYHLNVATAPEPTSLTLLGISALALLKRRKKIH